MDYAIIFPNHFDGDIPDTLAELRGLGIDAQFHHYSDLGEGVYPFTSNKLPGELRADIPEDATIDFFQPIQGLTFAEISWRDDVGGHQLLDLINKSEATGYRRPTEVPQYLLIRYAKNLQHQLSLYQRTPDRGPLLQQLQVLESEMIGKLTYWISLKARWLEVQRQLEGAQYPTRPDQGDLGIVKEILLAVLWELQERYAPYDEETGDALDPSTQDTFDELGKLTRYAQGIVDLEEVVLDGGINKE